MVEYLKSNHFKRLVPLILLIVIFEIYLAAQSIQCISISDRFRLMPDDIRAKVFEGIYADPNTSLFMIRVFHNQVVETGLAILASLYHFWDIYFLVPFISIVGTVSLWYGLGYFLINDRKNWLISITLIFISTIQLMIVMDLFKLSSNLTLGLLFMLYQLITLYGFINFSKRYLKYHPVYIYIAVAGLMILHIGWTSVVNFCKF